MTGSVPSWFRTTYLIPGLAPGAVAFKAVLVPQLLPALLTGHQHVQVADGELWRSRRERGPHGKQVKHVFITHQKKSKREDSTYSVSTQINTCKIFNASPSRLCYVVSMCVSRIYFKELGSLTRDIFMPCFLFSRRQNIKSFYLFGITKTWEYVLRALVIGEAKIILAVKQVADDAARLFLNPNQFYCCLTEFRVNPIWYLCHEETVLLILTRLKKKKKGGMISK